MVRDTLLLRGSIGPEYERLKTNGFFLHQCQNCHQVFPLQYPLIYRDVEQKFSILLTEQKKVDMLPEGRSILCRNSEEFLFAFHCLDAGQDVGRILRLQKSISEKERQEMKLKDIDPAAGVAVFQSENKEVLVRLPE